MSEVWNLKRSEVSTKFDFYNKFNGQVNAKYLRSKEIIFVHKYFKKTS